MTGTACRGCGGPEIVPVLSLGNMPLANALRSKDQLTDVEPAYPLELAFCPKCCLVQITESVPPEKMFTHYPYFSSFSETMVEDARRLTERMTVELGLGPGSLAIEIASNDGYLLQHYLAAGINVLGIDPAENVAAEAIKRGVDTICAFFGSDLAQELRSSGRRADVLHANNVIAHVPDINGFVTGIASVLAENGVAVIETPHVVQLVSRLEFDTIYHEHLFYYSLSSLRSILGRCGLEVFDVEEISIHGGSLRVFAALPGSRSVKESVEELVAKEEAVGTCGGDYYRDFAERVERLGTSLRTLLQGIKSEGKTIAAYGAAAKGAILLNAFDIGPETLDFIADKSTYKEGHYMPGCDVQIVEPGKLLEQMPDYTLLLAWNFADEIMAQQQQYREKGGRFIIPIPEPKVI